MRLGVESGANMFNFNNLVISLQSGKAHTSHFYLFINYTAYYSLLIRTLIYSTTSIHAFIRDSIILKSSVSFKFLPVLTY